MPCPSALWIASSIAIMELKSSNSSLTGYSGSGGRYTHTHAHTNTHATDPFQETRHTLALKP